MLALGKMCVAGPRLRDETRHDNSLAREYRARAHHRLFSSRSATALLDVAHRTSPVRNNLARPSSDHTPLGGLAVCGRAASRVRSMIGTPSLARSFRDGPNGSRECAPDDRLRTRPQMRNCASGNLEVLRCARAHHSSLVSLAPRNDGHIANVLRHCGERFVALSDLMVIDRVIVLTTSLKCLISRRLRDVVASALQKFSAS